MMWGPKSCGVGDAITVCVSKCARARACAGGPVEGRHVSRTVLWDAMSHRRLCGTPCLGARLALLRIVSARRVFGYVFGFSHRIKSFLSVVVPRACDESMSPSRTKGDRDGETQRDSSPSTSAAHSLPACWRLFYAGISGLPIPALGRGSWVEKRGPQAGNADQARDASAKRFCRLCVEGSAQRVGPVRMSPVASARRSRSSPTSAERPSTSSSWTSCATRPGQCTCRQGCDDGTNTVAAKDSQRHAPSRVWSTLLGKRRCDGGDASRGVDSTPHFWGVAAMRSSCGRCR